METFQFDLILRSLPLLIKGASLSLQILIEAAAVSLVLGSLLGICTCAQARSSLFGPIVDVIAFILRAVPFYVQLLIVYFVVPDLLKIEIDGNQASVIALGFCSSGYVAQIVRGSINAIPKEQWEAAYTLGYSKVQSVRYVILPQAFRNMVPNLTSELDSLLKSTAILSSIGMLELTRMGMNIVSREMAPLEIYLTVAAFYVAISLIINLSLRSFERRISYAAS